MRSKHTAMAKGAYAANGKSILKTVAGLIEQAATKFKVPPYDVTSAQFWSVATGMVDEWQVQKLGGLTNIRDMEFPPSQAPKYLAAVRNHDLCEHKLLEIARDNIASLLNLREAVLDAEIEHLVVKGTHPVRRLLSEALYALDASRRMAHERDRLQPRTPGRRMH